MELVLKEISLAEWIGFVFGIAGVILTVKENSWCFPIGLINVIVSLFLFFEQKLYSDAIQQVVYIVLLSYGWYKWIKGEQANDLPVTKSNPGLIIQLGILIFLLTVLMGMLFKKYSDASLPYLDALATSMSFCAQWMIARKKLENWLIWIDVNCLYIGIYIYKHLWLYVILFFIYLLLAIKGYFEWKKKLIPRHE